MDTDKQYKNENTITPPARYVCPVKPLPLSLVVVLIAGAVLLVVTIAMQLGRGM